MEDALITEHAGTRRDEPSRFYQYGSGGVRVLDARKTIKRLYLFDPSSDVMTERDPRRQEKILRRFVFDRFGMLEETFAFGERPRTFRYENGCRQIAVREGGDYGAVGKIFTYENNGITETAWGRNGEIERVYQFDTREDTIVIRAGGWYGDVERTIVFDGMGASLFLEPEAFLQFLMFTEWSAKDREEDINERVAKIRGPGSAGRSPYAFSGQRSGAGDGGAGSRTPAAKITGRKNRAAVRASDDAGIDFIPDGDGFAGGTSRAPAALSRPSRDISFGERRNRGEVDEGRLSPGRSAGIPLDERFGSTHEQETLSRGKSAEIPLDERFESAQKEREKKLSRGRSADIPYSERRGGRDR